MAIGRFGQAAARCILGTLALLVFAMAASCCYGADFVFIRSNDLSGSEQEEMQAAASFYGLNLREVTANAGANNAAIQAAIAEKETVGVAMDAGALSAVKESALLQALNRRAGRNIPLLILGVGPDADQAALRAWSGGAVTKCTRVKKLPDSQFTFGSIADVTGQLANVSFPYSLGDVSYFSLADSATTQQVEAIRGGGKSLPVFIENSIGRQMVFVAAEESKASNVVDKQDVVSAFLQIAPAMIFAKYCAGERGWHALHYYANFTIDDPWLREPYGYVDYEMLLGEMKEHNFHTTIAFIPWNYDRSQSEVVSIIRNHPDRFSIAIHGDNHDHKEFTDYRTKPLAVQVADLKQSLARMERFKALTGIPYDKVMIFPHSIAPEQTLESLKTYNYLATVNSSNVPQDTKRPAGLTEVLRPVTLSFKGFPSISRYSAEVQCPEAYFEINQFLGNPLFFYAHSDLFATGIGAFDHVADEVNKLEPATEWRSLGDIVRHLYVVRLRDDFNYDVLAFSSDICLENTSGRSSTFYVQKQEIGGQTIDSVTVNGIAHPYTLQNGQITLAVAIPSGGTRCVAIQYANDLQLSAIDVSHKSTVVYLLRMGSDFRDIYLAKSGAGLAAIRFYNEHELRPTEVVVCLAICFAGLSYGAWRIVVFVRRRPGSSKDRTNHVTV